MHFRQWKRREFITLLGGAASWPLAARAQQPMPLIGFLHSASPEPVTHILAGFHHGLGDTGYVEGRNLAIEYRWARGRYDQLSALAADLLQRRVAVIVAGGGEHTARAAKMATSTVPVVFTSASDPVRAGLVASLNRPGGNLTGTVSFTSVVETKKFGLLREMVPDAAATAMLINPTFPPAEPDAKEVQAAAQTLGHRLFVLRASNEQEIDTAFATLVEQRAGALLVAGDPFFNSRREQLVALAARHSLPGIYEFREYVVAGGLMSYGISLPDNYRQMGIYVGRILQGAKPAELPIMQPTKFVLAINLRTAKTLSLSVPPSLLAIADEVIE
jgi:putative ABC transport system substrate-binding protein